MRSHPTRTPVQLAAALALALAACAPKASHADPGPDRSDPAAATAAAPAKADFEWAGDVRRVSVSTVEGDVRVVPTSGKDVRVRGTKSGKDAKDVTIEVKKKGDGVAIGPKYPERGNTDARVDFVVEVPAGVAVDVNAVHGELDATGVTAALSMSTVDGDIATADCGDVRGNTVNGKVKVALPKRGAKRVALEAVNGELEVRMPAGVGASVRANTVSGEIRSDFPLSKSDEVVGSRASGKIGDGSATIDLSTVNGPIALSRA
jgi:DUF4097 and DUF4098 domain-containing protein YvlB